MTPAKANPDDADESLKRLGGGRWQTRDERFTIEPQSGTWAVVDAEATDDLGLPLVRGPFRSLTDAKAAIAAARTSEPAESPLAERLERGRSSPASASASASASKPKASKPTPAEGAVAGVDDAPAAPAPRSKQASAPLRAAVAEPAEPSWMRDLEPAERGRARRLIDRLTTDGVPDAESIVRRDLAGGVPALAAHAIGARLTELPTDASPADVVEILAEGRDERLGVRWRIVDGDGRPILVEAPKRGRSRG